MGIKKMKFITFISALIIYVIIMSINSVSNNSLSKISIEKRNKNRVASEHNSKFNEKGIFDFGKKIYNYGKEKVNSVKKSAKKIYNYGKEKVNSVKKSAKKIYDYGKSKLNSLKKLVTINITYN